ncbi:MAG: bifunctional folylpolyglutamate synthase/dihydrofolate synthase [bacterium]|nr:bifunctional folylpolyglutamate synthase/dihydrofolate synthase [bacterium]MDT8395430.1 folylpolyglutamate synthase/dihydrofolate synthase family protein [bacterium]
MNPELALYYLASLNESRIKPGLERIDGVLKSLGHPHREYPHMLVAGTNGKGSVVAMTGAVLSASGLVTGRFTSPHLHGFAERIVVGERPVTPDELTELVCDVRDTGVELTYFEFATAMALLHFARRKVDVAILEVGLGGRWDATNVTDPFLSVITSVDLDHGKWLGSTVEEVAANKAPVMRAGRRVIVGPVVPEARDVILRYADKAGSDVVLFGRDFNARWEAGGEPGGRTLQFNGRKWSMGKVTPGLPGRFQLGNAACVLAAVESMDGSGWSLDMDDAVRGLGEARWPGRFQWVQGRPPVLVDGAHNPAAVRALVDSLEGIEPAVWLVSALADKDLGGMAAWMGRLGRRVVLVPLDHPRAAGVREMAGQFPEGFEVRSAESVSHGLKMAREWAGESGTVIAAGSIVLAGKVLEELGKQEPEVEEGMCGDSSIDCFSGPAYDAGPGPVQDRRLGGFHANPCGRNRYRRGTGRG